MDMPLSQQTIQDYKTILTEELLVAMGCTEPISIAYAAAILRKALGEEPTCIHAQLSGNIIKNVKSVIVTFDGEGEERRNAIYPLLVETKGPNPIEFENGYVAFEDLPDDKKKNPDDDDFDDDDVDVEEDSDDETEEIYGEDDDE